MKYTKATFEMVASTIKARIEDPSSLGARACVRGLAADFADQFAASNPRFDRERFMKACGASECEDERRIAVAA